MTDAENLAEEIIQALEQKRSRYTRLIMEASCGSDEHAWRNGKAVMGVAIDIARAVVARWKAARKDAEHMWDHQPGTPCPRCGQTHGHWHTGKADDPAMAPQERTFRGRKALSLEEFSRLPWPYPPEPDDHANGGAP